MRDFVIVTVSDTMKIFDYDLELPTGEDSRSLASDIAQVLKAYDPTRIKFGPPYQLFCQRLNRVLTDGETLADAGVWSGDRLVINGTYK